MYQVVNVIVQELRPEELAQGNPHPSLATGAQSRGMNNIRSVSVDDGGSSEKTSKYVEVSLSVSVCLCFNATLFIGN